MEVILIKKKHIKSYTEHVEKNGIQSIFRCSKTVQSPKSPKRVHIYSPPKRILDFEIYTDGGYDIRNRVGSWSFIIKAKDMKPIMSQRRHRFEFAVKSGTFPVNYTVYPIMCEIEAVVQAIRHIFNNLHDDRFNVPIEVHHITVKTDSFQISNCKTLIERYKNTEWFSYITGKPLPTEIIHHWLRLDSLNIQHGDYLDYEWIKGHNGNLYNERCDKACTKRIQKALSE